MRHVLRLMGRVGVLLDGDAALADEEREEDDPGRRAVAREVAAEGTVLLVNDGLLAAEPGRSLERGRDRPERRASWRWAAAARR